MLGAESNLAKYLFRTITNVSPRLLQSEEHAIMALACMLFQASVDAPPCLITDKLAGISRAPDLLDATIESFYLPRGQVMQPGIRKEVDSSLWRSHGEQQVATCG